MQALRRSVLVRYLVVPVTVLALFSGCYKWDIIGPVFRCGFLVFVLIPLPPASRVSRRYARRSGWSVA